jgi:uncharacterized repeat protein (TIGR03803 family)
MKQQLLLILFVLFGISTLNAQTSYYGMTSSGGASGVGTIFKTDATGSNLQTVFDFNYHHAGRTPKSVFTQASNGKIYGTTRFGGSNLCSFPYYQYQKYSGVIFEYDPTNDNYTVLFNFDDTTTGCWPGSAPVLASNGKLYGVTPGIGGFSQHYGTVYSYDLATGIYTKIHSFGVGSDGENPVGNLLLASDGKLYGVTSDGGFNDKGVIFTIDPATDTYTKKLDLQDGWYGNKAAQDARAGLIQASNGKMYGTSESGGNYPNGYQYAYGNIFEYNPTTNVATNLYGFSDTGLGKNPTGAPVLVGTNNLYCVTYQYYQIPGTYNQEPHYYLWKYTISSGTATVVDSIANGYFNSDFVVNTSGKIILTGHDYNISSATRFWEFNPSTNTRTLLDTSANLRYFYKGLMLASNGNYYAGGAYPDPYNPLTTDDNGSFVEYNLTNHTVTEKFRFSEPVDGIEPEGDLVMATNGKFYGSTSKGGMYNKGVVFEFNPVNNTYSKKFDLDSSSGYEPKGGLMEASNGNLYGLTYKGGNGGYGTVFEIDTTTWTLTKKADCSVSAGAKPVGRLVEAWDGNLYGISSYYYGSIFQFDISTNTITTKHSFTSSAENAPQGGLALADNGKLYGLTKYNAADYYSEGVLFEYDPVTNTYAMKKQLYNYTGYRPSGNTPLQGSDGTMYLLISAGGSGNTMYEGGTVCEYTPGATSIPTYTVFSPSNTGSLPYGDLMESANGKFYGYTWIGGANNKGTLFEYNSSTNTITKKQDFNGTNGALPMHGSLSESNTAPIVITQQTSITGSSCIGDTVILSIAATHGTLLHYQWYKDAVRVPGATNDSLTIYGLTSSDAGNYTCKVTGGTKAVISTAYILTPNPKPIVSISGLANSYCANDTNIVMSANVLGGVFSGTGVSDSIFSPITAGVGVHDVFYAYTDAQGCSNTDTASVTINSLPDASFSGVATSYCDNDEIDTLVPSIMGGSFIGSGLTNDEFDPSYFASSTALVGFPQFIYTITDANGCTNSDTISSIIHHAPIVSLSGLNTTYCANDEIDTLIMSPTGGTITAGSFLNGTIFTPSNAVIGINDIYYSYTNSYACSNADTMQIMVNAAPDASFSGLDVSYCINDDQDTMLATTSGGVFSGDIVNGNIFNPQLTTIPGGALSVSQKVIYTLTNSDGCTDVDTVTTTVYPLPIVNFGTLASSFCDNDSPVSLVNNGTPIGGVYSGNGIVGNTFNPSLAGIGTDTLVYTFTNSNSCVNSDTAYTIINEAPIFSLPNDTDICINNVLTISTGLSGNYVYLWTDGSTGSSLTIDAATEGVGVHYYMVYVVDSQNNCGREDTIKVTINACTGIDNNEFDEKAVAVYPNPSAGLFTIDSDIEIDQLEVYSTQGKLIYSEEVNFKGSDMKLDLRNHTPGVYYLLIMSGDNILRKQLIIK